MKKLFGTLMVLALMLALLPVTATAHTEADPLVVDLLAGQHMDVGDVLVWNDADYLYVKYVITESGWCISETHLAVAASLDGIPQTKTGNPIPGRFPYSGSHGCIQEFTYQIPLAEDGADWRCKTELHIAAHAVVRTTGDKECGRTETAWGDGEDFPGRNWATYFGYAIQCEPEPWPEGGTTTVAFEDLPLSGGNDWDYNDFVADIDVEATFWGSSPDRELFQIDFTVRPQERLAGFTHAMYLDTSAFACNGSYELYRDGISVELGDYNDGTGIDVLLVPDTATPPVEVLLSMSFDEDCQFSFPEWDQNQYHGENLFFDPYLYVNDTPEEIRTGDPRMLTVPVDWQWPDEGLGIWTLYPKVTEGAPGDPPTFVPYWWTP